MRRHEWREKREEEGIKVRKTNKMEGNKDRRNKASMMRIVRDDWSKRKERV